MDYPGRSDLIGREDLGHIHRQVHGPQNTHAGRATPVATIDQLWQPAAVGPIPGEVMVAGGVLYNAACIAIALNSRARTGARPIPW
jgi:uncharacterized membrane protein